MIPVSDKHTVYFLLGQMILHQVPQSLIPASSGIISGAIYHYILSGLFKLDRRIKFPDFVVRFASNVIRPMIQGSTTPAMARPTANRNTNDQQVHNMMMDDLNMGQNAFVNPQPQQQTTNIPEDSIQQLMQMGFPRSACETALRHANNDLHLATELLLHE